MDEKTAEQLAAENRRLQQQIEQLRNLDSGGKKLEFSKLIFICVSIGTVAITIFSCVMAWRTMDTSVLTYLIPSAFAELATGTGFYYWKSKADNKIKLSARLGVNPDASTFND